ncbi:MAG: nickel-dependent lactate racemase [Candidatus Poribacteria bacterium]|nr:nickel-dependent lactate racemase [Candidatus Poribacteria bacterium]MDE0506872.1 nickel-dependent lactate racemase [Candidatus Poribacteria bacterium]
MRVGVKYGRGTLDVDVPEENLAGILAIQPSKPIQDSDTSVRKALATPINSLPLAQLVDGQSSACIIISDITRPVPNQVILPPILQTLEQQGIPREKIIILIATGIHRPSTEKELEEMVGLDIMANYRIVNHLSGKPDTHKYLGLTRNGTPVHIDKTYLESDLKIVTGLIEPHLMAGYSGGRKAICPGISSVETMQVMHGPLILEHPKASVGVLDDNPFHLEATEIALMAGVDFSLNVAIDNERQITGIFAGELVESHKTGCEFVDKQVTATLSHHADIVVVSSAGYPLDTTFYQAIKGLLTAAEVVKPNGTIVLAAECSQGIGSKPFTDLVLETQNLDQFIQDIYEPENFVVDQWQLEELAKVARRADIYFYTEGIIFEEQHNLFVRPLRHLQEGIDLALDKHGCDAKVAVIPDGPYVLAKVETPSIEAYN